MELDIDLALHGVPPALAVELGQLFYMDFQGDREAAACLDITIWANESPQPIIATIDAALHDFLEKLMPHVLVIVQATPVLRLGIFYDLEETVVFPLRLGAATIRLMAAMGIELEAYGYPCADEPDAT